MLFLSPAQRFFRTSPSASHHFARAFPARMGRHGGGGRGGGGRGGGGRGNPGDDRPTLPRGMREEIETATTQKRASGFEDSDLGERRGAGGEPMRGGDGGGRGGGRGGAGGRGTTLDRKAQRKLAKDREKTQRQQWSDRKSRVKARDTPGGGGGGVAKGDGKATSRDSGNGKRDTRGDDKDEDTKVTKKQKKATAAGVAVGDGARGPTASKKSLSRETQKTTTETTPAKKPTKLAPELRMNKGMLEAFRRDEADQKRLLKRLKGRQKGPDDGLGDFFENLPGMELLADDDDDDDDKQKKQSKQSALGVAAANASRRKKVSLESDSDSADDDGDPFGFGGEEDEDGEMEDDDDDSMEDDDDVEDDQDEDSDEDEAEETVADEHVQPASGGKYVPPALRAAMAGSSAKACSGASVSEQKTQSQALSAARLVRGLINRMGESNVPSIVAGVAALASDLPRRTVGDAATNETIKALTEGPRVSSQYAAAVAAFIGGLAGALGPEVGARFGVEVVRCLNAARGIGGAGVADGNDASTDGPDDSSSVRAASNAAAVFSRLFISGLFPSATLWGFLEDATVRLSELDVTLMLGVLRVAGAKLRSEDPVGMKRFIEVLQGRVAEEAAGGGEILNPGGINPKGVNPKETLVNNPTQPLMTKRARLMLTMVIDLKNNKRGGNAVEVSGSENRNQNEDVFGFPNELGRFIRGDPGIGDATVALRQLTYEKLLPKHEHARKGQWWLPDAAGTEAWFTSREASKSADVNAARDAKSLNLSNKTGEGAELLNKAKAMRMNTESRKAVFCIIMGAEDFTDALDGLLRLPLRDAQHREIPRVLVECVLSEKSYNPYYETLASKLCERAAKKHRMTLQLCVWDQIRVVAPAPGGDADGGPELSVSGGDKPSVRRVSHLARFIVGLLISGALSPVALKVVDFGNGGAANDAATATARLFRRLLLQALLSVHPKKVDKSELVFQTIAEKGLGVGGEIGALRVGLERALGDEKSVTEGLSRETEDVGKPNSFASVRDAARRARRILRGELA